MSGAVDSRPEERAGFESTARDFWASRPRRARRGRKIAGVAAGIGDRYGIDPVIVRVALIVATILGGGLGVLVYLIAWLILPAEGDEVSGAEALIGRGRSSMSPHVTFGLCIAIFVVSGWAFGGSWFAGGGFVMLGLMVAGLYLLHRERGRLHRPGTTLGNAHGGAPASFHADGTDTTAEVGTGADGGAPPAWDPLGAAPTGWDLPDAGLAPSEPAAPRPPRRRSAAGVLTLGLALITAGVGTALAVFGYEWFTPAHIVGLTLAVIGLGMVIGAFTGGARSLTWLAVPLAIAGLVLTTVPFGEMGSGGWGELDAAPKSVSEVRPSYERSGGDIRLDLTEVPYSATPIKTKVAVGMGSAEVIVPEDADVSFTCTSQMGDLDCLGREQHGMGMNEPVRDTDTGEDGPGGQRIELDVSARMGSVEVNRD